MRLVIFILGFSHFGYSQIYNNENGAYSIVSEYPKFSKFAFIIYDTTFNHLVLNTEELSVFLHSFSNDHFQKLEKKIRTSKPEIETFKHSKNTNWDSLMLEVRNKLNDYMVVPKFQRQILDELGIDESCFEKYENRFYQVFEDLILEKHRRLNYKEGVTFSQIVWYGKYGIQILLHYHFTTSFTKPLYAVLVVHKKNHRGKIKSSNFYYSNQLC